MKKGSHPVAIALWLATVLYVALFVMLALMRLGPPPEPIFIQSNTWAIIDGIRSALWGVAVLASLAVLVELVDQIRWNALPPEKQISRRFFFGLTRRGD